MTAPAPKKDPAATLTRRLKLLDSKLDLKHAEIEVQAGKSEEAMEGFKACAADQETRMTIKAWAEAELQEEDREDVPA